MGILDEDIERVRSSTSIEEVIGEHVALRPQGARLVGLCPFHAEKTASFSVNRELGAYYCFGCSAKGDAITFLRETQHLDFVGAVEALAKRAGIELRYDSGRETGERRRRSVLVEAMARSVDWYHDRLLHAPDAAHARGYLRSRGYDGDLVRRYRLGWAPDEWDALVRALSLPADVLRDTGLGLVNRRGRLQDRFRARVLFPLFDVGGQPVAFGGRILPGGEGPKYLNSPATALYDKAKTLYGLNWAKAAVVERGEVVLSEGYTDVIGLDQAGVPHAVGICGTALTEHHVAALRRYCRRIVLALDADSAGQSAAERFYEWEGRFEVDLLVAALPPGSDPGDLARTDPEALHRCVREARPFLDFLLRRALDRASLGTPEGRARAAQQALALVAQHPNELVRDQYLMEVADRCRIDSSRLRATLAAGSTRQLPLARRRPERAERPALLALALALQRPETVAGLLDEVLFSEDVDAATYRAVVATADLRAALDAAGPEEAELLQRAAVVEVDAEPEDVVATLVSEGAGRVLRDLRAEARAAADPLQYNALVGWLKLRMEELWRAESRAGAIRQLVPFLVDRARERAPEG